MGETRSRPAATGRRRENGAASAHSLPAFHGTGARSISEGASVTIMGPRDATYNPQFDAELAELVADARCADEFVRGAEWVLCQDPTQGHPLLPGSCIWVLSMVEANRSPSLELHYVFDDHCVTFLAIHESFATAPRSCEE